MPGVSTDLRFPLYLLSHMVHARDNVDRALSALGATRAQMVATAEEVGEELSLLRLRRTVENVRTIAGPPVYERTEGVGQGRGKVLGFQFPAVWPEFSFEVHGNSDGFWASGGFVRKFGSDSPAVEDPGQLVSWDFLISEVDAAFGPLEEGDMWSPYEGYLLSYRSAHGTPARYGIDFCWGLLQAVQKEHKQEP